MRIFSCTIVSSISPFPLSSLRDAPPFLLLLGSIKISPPSFYYWNKFCPAGPRCLMRSPEPNASLPADLFLATSLILAQSNLSHSCRGNLSSLIHSLSKGFTCSGFNASQPLFRFRFNGNCIFNCMRPPPFLFAWPSLFCLSAIKSGDMQSVAALSYSQLLQLAQSQ